MAIDLSEFIMPMHVDLDNFSGGFDYQDFRAPGVTGLTHYWQVGDIIDIDVSAELGSFENGKNVTVPIIRFSNGYVVKTVFEYRPSGNNAYIQCTNRLYNSEDVQINFPTISGVSWYGSWSLMGVTPQAYIYPFVKVKVFLNTTYYPQTPNSITPPSDVRFTAVVSGACTAAQYDEGGNNIANFNSGLVNAYYDLQYYSSITHAYGTYDYIKFTSDGLNNFNEWLNGTGGGGGFTPSGGGGGGGEPAGSDDNSEPGGGDGNYDDESDPVDFPDLPTGGALECGAILAHRVSKQTLEAIFTKLWNKSLIDISNMWQKSIQDPMDAIVSLHALPVSPDVEADPDNIFVGNLDMGVSSPKVTSQYVEVDCGSLTLKEFWGSALDYSPYTRVEIFLPFIGMKTLRTEDVIKSTITIKYHIDILSGDCIAFIKCGISVLYTYNGNCKMMIPLSSRSTDFLQKAAIAAGLAVGAGSVAVGGGAAAAAATKAPAVAAAGITQSAANLQAGSMLISGASNVASTKINTSRGGDISSALSLMADFVPYVIIHRPVQSLAKDYNKFKGYTSNITAQLGSLTGYTEVEHVHISNIPNATEAELAEIHSLLVGGVII